MPIIDNEYLDVSIEGTGVGSYYNNPDINWKLPPKVANPKNKNEFFEAKAGGGINKSGKPSIFNRYSIFFFNSLLNDASKSEDFYDKPGRIGDSELQAVRDNPTSSRIIEWSKKGQTNSVEYAWEDFLWCTNYGRVPNNYMVTLRRFAVPPVDNILDSQKNKSPDIARMITWVDGEVNKWESVGLKWNHKMNFKEITAELQQKENLPGYGNETNAIGGSLMKSLASLTDTAASKASRENNPALNDFDPYQDKNVVFGPIDVIDKTNIRNRGLDFTQEISLVFDYQLRSIDGINPKIAQMDLLSNILLCTMNRGAFWGGEVRFYGGNPRLVKPFGDPSKLASGDFGGYFKSVLSGLSNTFTGLAGGKGGNPLEQLGAFARGIGGNLLNQLAGNTLDKMGRPGVQAIDSLLTGEPTGEWHLMVGNPANPIMSIGNLYLEDTEVEFYGPVGFDDFPSGLKVTCKLKPGRPRDRTEIISMFHRNHRTYLSNPPEVATYTGNKPKGGYGPGQHKFPTGQRDKKIDFKSDNFKMFSPDLVKQRFPNHNKTVVDASTNLIG